MAVDQTWLAVLCVVCCAPSVLLWTRMRLQQYRHRYGPPRLSPGLFLGSWVDGLLMGIGTGLSVVLLVLLVSVVVQLVVSA